MPRRHGETPGLSLPQELLYPLDPDMGLVFADMGAWHDANPCDCEASCYCDGYTVEEVDAVDWTNSPSEAVPHGLFDSIIAATKDIPKREADFDDRLPWYHPEACIHGRPKKDCNGLNHDKEVLL
jgi:hypothetical protein